MNALALQGGGVLGYSQSIILTELEKRAGKPTSALFDIIGGTSVGSIIGAGLSIGVPALTIQNFFTVDAPKIFDTDWLDEIESAVVPKYSASPLETALQGVLGTSTLRDCKTRFFAIAYDYASDRPVYFKSYDKSSQDDRKIIIGNDSNIMLWQVCRASAAAQTYFPGYAYTEPVLGNLAMVLIDGGNTGDNAPDVKCISELTKLGIALSDIRMLSLGTGNSPWNVTPSDMIRPSPLRAGLATVKIVFSVGSDVRNDEACDLIGMNNYFHIAAVYSTPVAIDDASESSLANLALAAQQAIIGGSASLDEFAN